MIFRFVCLVLFLTHVLSQDVTQTSNESQPLNDDETESFKDESQSLEDETLVSESKSQPPMEETQSLDDQTQSSKDETQLLETESQPRENEAQPMKDGTQYQSEPRENETQIDEIRLSKNESQARQDESQPRMGKAHAHKDKTQALEDKTQTNEDESQPLEDETQSHDNKTKPHDDDTQTQKDEKLPNINIVIIVADDLGWNDVSFHGSDQIMTPNIDTLAYEGLILHQYYTDTLGTSSRSALFTGKYALRLGMQSVSIKASEDRGIPVTEKLLPSYLKELGYETHLIGKWHVGKSRQHYMPTYRGFDTFYGFLGDAVDYRTYNLIEEHNFTSFFGLDFFENTSPVDDISGHLTDVLTDRAVQVIRDYNSSAPLYLHVSHAAPHAGGALVNLQPPDETIAANEHIAHSARRNYAGLVTSLDKSVGRIVATLAEKAILQNTLIVFVSDNGAPTIGVDQNFGSNLPLRGIKNTPWEGGARSIALMWNPSLNSGIWNGLFHVTDWLPTLVTAAGGNVDPNIDGINHWDVLIKGGQPKRNDVLITIDDIEGWAAFREGDFKMVVGDLKKEISRYFGAELKALRHEAPFYEQVLLESETCHVFKETLDIVLDLDSAFAKRNRTNLLLTAVPVNNAVLCIPTRAKGCLYNITDDPLETNDIWESSPDIVKRMSLRLRLLWSELIPRWTPLLDMRANPSSHNYTWTPWVPNDEIPLEPPTTTPPFPLQVTMSEIQYLFDLNLNTFRQKMSDSIKSMGSSFMKSIGGLFPVFN